MQKQIFAPIGREADSFSLTLQKAQSGDNRAVLTVLDFLLPDMEYLASFIKLPREESMQEMKTAMLEVIRSGEVML
ncbi:MULTISPECIES: hypothetical protein [Bacillales]|uniref:hypothetical protein n=1 Tax=Bacillales TaxID=1385 RepID=UPI00067077FD|nr:MULTISPECIES: hypothetical protein [Bacillales]KMZ44208.1 hypothetical protein AC624_25725 [Bacillus sp. FJAT-27238]